MRLRLSKQFAKTLNRRLSTKRKIGSAYFAITLTSHSERNAIAAKHKLDQKIKTKSPLPTPSITTTRFSTPKLLSHKIPICRLLSLRKSHFRINLISNNKPVLKLPKLQRSIAQRICKLMPRWSNQAQRNKNSQTSFGSI